MSNHKFLQSIVIVQNPASIITFSDIKVKNINIPPEIVEILESRLHPDRWDMQPKDQKYTVSDIDELVRWESMRPTIGHYKVAIINHAETLSLDTQNKLLKTLEEPNLNTQLILICENQNKLLPTVLSRCVIVQDFLESNIVKYTDNPLISEFIDVEANIEERLALAEQIADSDQATEITIAILDYFVELTLAGKSKIGVKPLMDIFSSHRKNIYANRLTLETLAIMLR